MKYNLALVPLSKGDEIISLAKKFVAIADTYLLGKRSLPHVTLYQFHAEETEAPKIWQRACQIREEKPIVLTFNQFSYKTFDETIFWLALLPNHCDILHALHGRVADALRFSSKKTFDPHMTLINTKNKEYAKKIPLLVGPYKPIVDTFILALGKSDEIGQLTDITCV